MCYNINQAERNKTMNNEQKKPAEELSEKELEGVVGGGLARAGLAKMVEDRMGTDPLCGRNKLMFCSC